MMCGGGDKPIYISLSSQVPHDTRTSPSPFRATPGDPGRCLTKPGHAHQCAHGARRLVSPLSIRGLPPGNWPICRYSAVPRRPRDLLIFPPRSSQVPRANWRSIAPNGRRLPRHQGPPVGSPPGPAGRLARANPVPGSGRPAPGRGERSAQRAPEGSSHARRRALP
jgi:hypothetical protein